ncbi:hypothetical protein J4228_02110 [Candidatus Woesearchaeota archaeon]|nr:hypothetical protein [Candidatus Woesearchaeota archaeon]
MAKELLKIEQEAQNAIKHLAAEFNYVEELQDHLQRIEEESEHIPKDLREAKAMLRLFKLTAREEKRVAHSEDELESLLEEFGTLLPREQKQKEEQFARELQIASGLLKKLVSFYRGEIKGKIIDVEKEEKLLTVLEKNPKQKDADTLAVRKKLNEEFFQLNQHVQNLLKWIETNTMLAENIQKWAADLEV